MRADPPQQKQLDALKANHFETVKQGLDWLKIWKVFSDSPWYRSFLQQSVDRVVSRFQVSSDLANDLYQDADMMFATCLHKRVDLNFKSELGDYQYFLQTIIYRCCTKAAIRLKKEFKTTAPLPSAIVGEDGLPESPYALTELIDKLEDPSRLVLHLYLDGQSFAAIAKTIGRSERTVYRIFKQAIERLRKIEGMGVSKQSRSDWN